MAAAPKSKSGRKAPVKKAPHRKTAAHTLKAPDEHPLSGIAVIDLSHVYNGPYATFLMALAGAEVIKIEPPQGEHLRSRGALCAGA